MSTDLPIGTLKLADNCIPALKADEYQIEVTYSITGNNGSISESSTSPPTPQKFRVAGPRFSLDISSVYSCSPSPGSQGVYETHLPDIVISEPYFPWERALVSNDTSVPWVALIVLSADELLSPVIPAGQRITGPNADKVYTLDSADKLAGLSISNVNCPSISSSMPAEDKVPCKLIVVPKTLFNKFFGTLSSGSMYHKYYAHYRKINSGSYQIDGLTEKGDFSVIFGSRFPKPSAVNYVHLVSLEGYQNTINVGSTKDCCMVSLYSWSFVCDSTKSENFHDLMSRLGPTATAPLTVPSSTTNAQIRARLSNGFIPVKYHLRTGEDTMGWYRGPFTPVQVDSRPFTKISGPITSVSGTNLLIFDPAYGTFDITYAAAWQLGRSLALSSSKFLSALMEFRQSVYQSVNTQIANQMYQVSPTTAKNQFIQNLPNLFQSIALATNNHFDRTSISQATNLSNLTQNLSRRSLSSYWPPSPDSYNGLTGLTIKSMATNDPNYTIVLQWLSSVMLFRGVPLHYLIPNQNLLPIETMRFFFVDTAWLNFLIDGALSPAVHSDRDQIFRQEIKNQLALNTQNASNPQKPLYGIIMRSIVVADWPGLVVTASTGSTTAPTDCKPIEVRRLPPNILMAFFPQPITSCRISQPPEQLRFGASGESTLLSGSVFSRSLDQSTYGKTTGQTINPNSYLAKDDNNNNTTIINTATLMPKLGSSLTPSQFAIQMIAGAEYQDFSLANPAISPSFTTAVQISSFSGSGHVINGSYSTILTYTFTSSLGPCYWRLSSTDSSQVYSGIFAPSSTTGQLGPNNLRPAAFTLTLVDSITGSSASRMITLSSSTGSYTYT